MGSIPIFSTKNGIVVAKVADRTVTPGVERLYAGSSPVSTAKNMVYGAAWCGYSTVTGEKQVGSNPI